jgi:hypothetical protein
MVVTMMMMMDSSIVVDAGSRKLEIILCFNDKNVI